MTREEAISLLTQVNKILVNSNSWLENTHEPLNMAFDMAIKALKQEPCEDAVSRQAVIVAMRNNYRDGGRDIDGDYVEGTYSKKLYDVIISLPPVNPQPKTGHWIPVSERLPEEREWYLAVFKEKDTDFQLIPRVADYRGHGEWQLMNEEGLPQEYRDLLECVAWMPLPAPYGPRESEEI